MNISPFEEGMELIEHLYFENPWAELEELLVRASQIPADAIIKSEVDIALGAHLYDATPIENIRALAHALRIKIDWSDVIYEAVNTLGEGGYSSLEKITRLLARCRGLYPDYQPTDDFVSGILRSFGEEGAPLIKKAFESCGIDPINAFTGDCCLPFDRKNKFGRRRENLPAGRVIVETAIDRGIDLHELKTLLHSEWWQIVQDYAKDRSDFLWDVSRQGGKLNDSFFDHAHQAIKFIEEEG